MSLDSYNDKKTNFNELLVNDGSLSIHHQNFKKLAVEMLKVSRGLSPKIVNGLFQFRDQIPFELRQRSLFQIPLVYLVLVVHQALNFLGQRYRNFEMQQNNRNLHPILSYEDYAKDI